MFDLEKLEYLIASIREQARTDAPPNEELMAHGICVAGSDGAIVLYAWGEASSAVMEYLHSISNTVKHTQLKAGKPFVEAGGLPPRGKHYTRTRPPRPKV